jgi:hypothetical protein
MLSNIQQSLATAESAGYRVDLLNTPPAPEPPPIEPANHPVEPKAEVPEYRERPAPEPEESENATAEIGPPPAATRNTSGNA